MRLQGWSKGKGVPLLSLHEFAKELGIPLRNLAMRVGKSKDSPPMIRRTQCHDGKKEHCKYYEAEALRAWWKRNYENT